MYFYFLLSLLARRTYAQTLEMTWPDGYDCEMQQAQGDGTYCVDLSSRCLWDGTGSTPLVYPDAPLDFQPGSCGVYGDVCMDSSTVQQCSGNRLFSRYNYTAVPIDSSESYGCAYGFDSSRWVHVSYLNTCCSCPEGTITAYTGCGSKYIENGCLYCSDGVTVPQLNPATNRHVCNGTEFRQAACSQMETIKTVVDTVNYATTLLSGLCIIKTPNSIVSTALTSVISVVNAAITSSQNSPDASSDKKALLDNILSVATGLIITGAVVGTGIAALPEEAVLVGAAAMYLKVCDLISKIGLVGTGIAEVLRLAPSCADLGISNAGNLPRTIDGASMSESEILPRDTSDNPCLDYLALFPPYGSTLPQILSGTATILRYNPNNYFHAEEINATMQMQNVLRQQSSGLQQASLMNDWLNAIEAFAPYCGMDNSVSGVATTSTTTTTGSTTDAGSTTSTGLTTDDSNASISTTSSTTISSSTSSSTSSLATTSVTTASLTSTSSQASTSPSTSSNTGTGSSSIQSSTGSTTSLSSSSSTTTTKSNNPSSLTVISAKTPKSSTRSQKTTTTPKQTTLKTTKTAKTSKTSKTTKTTASKKPTGITTPKTSSTKTPKSSKPLTTSSSTSRSTSHTRKVN